MVEFTLLLPLILVLALGILEFGMLFKDHMGVHYASREGARTGAAASRLPNADCSILRAVATTMQTMEYDMLQRVRIFRADTTGEECLMSGGSCPENVYIRNAGGGTLQCNGQTTDWILMPPVGSSQYWPPDGNPGRVNIEPTDALAVEVQYLHRFFFNYVPGAEGTVAIVDRSVMQIEPARLRPIPTP
jgi:hypothetical protein